MEEDRPPTDPSQARVFDNVISRLNQSYPKDKMDEISTSFCFICLLHLANEQGLKLEVGSDEVRDDAMEEDVEEDRKVGSIWGLKVSLAFSGKTSAYRMMTGLPRSLRHPISMIGQDTIYIHRADFLYFLGWRCINIFSSCQQPTAYINFCCNLRGTANVI